MLKTFFRKSIVPLGLFGSIGGFIGGDVTEIKGDVKKLIQNLITLMQRLHRLI